MGETVIEASDNSGYKLECQYGIMVLISPQGEQICEFMPEPKEMIAILKE